MPLIYFPCVYFEKESIEIELLRKEKWGNIDFLTEKFAYDLDENYEDEEDLGICKQYIFNFDNEEKVIEFLSAYRTYVQKLLRKQ